MSNTLLEAGKRYLKNGLSIMIISADKVPVHKWKELEKKQMTVSELEKYIKYRDAIGIGIITGYNDIEVLDFDLKYDDTGTLMQEYEAKIPLELKDKMVIVQTRSGGYHWSYQCKEIGGNEKLANKENKEVLIETRGIGGYIATAPTPNYKYISGRLQYITPEERLILFSAARSFNRLPYRPKYIPPKIPYSGDDRPGDDFNKRGDVVKVLEDAGWKFVDEDSERLYFLRPGKKDQGNKEYSGNWNKELRLFKVFSSSTDLEEGRAYELFSLYVDLLHSGDPATAAKQLRKEGYGGAYPEDSLLAAIEEDLPEFLKQDNPNVMAEDNFMTDVFELAKQHAPLITDPNDGTLLNVKPRFMAREMRRLWIQRKNFVLVDAEESSEPEEKPEIGLEEFVDWYRNVFTKLPDAWKGWVEANSSFPLDIYPLEIRKFIHSQTLQPDYLAASIFSAVSTAIGNTAQVFISHGRVYKATLNILLVGDSGQMKSPALKVAYSAIADYDKRSSAAWIEAHDRWKADKKRYDDNKDKNKSPFLDPEPIHYQAIINNITMAMVGRVLSRNKDGCVLKVDELRGWFKVASNPQTGEKELWISLLDGDDTRIQRRGASGEHEQDLVIMSPFTSIAGTTQPDFLKDCIGGENLSNGLGYRFNFCFPDNEPIRRPNRSTTPPVLIKAFNKFFEDILSGRKKKGIEEARTYQVSDPVFEMMSQWARSRILTFMDDKDKKGFWKKYEERTFRIALILQVMDDRLNPDDIDNVEISFKSMRGAMILMDYFIAQAWKVLETIRNYGKRIVTGEYEQYFENLPILFKLSDAIEMGIPYGKTEAAIKKKLGEWVKDEFLIKRQRALYEKNTHF